MTPLKEKEKQHAKQQHMQQPQMNIDLSQTTEEVCEACENTTFTQVYKIRRLSALLAPSGQATMIPMQVFSCVKCNHINDIFLPKDD